MNTTLLSLSFHQKNTRTTMLIFAFVGPQKSPSQGVSIRAISPDKYTVINQATNEVIEEVEESKAFFEVLHYHLGNYIPSYLCVFL